MILKHKEIDWDAEDFKYQVFYEDLKEFILDQARVLIRNETNDFWERDIPSGVTLKAVKEQEEEKELFRDDPETRTRK